MRYKDPNNVSKQKILLESFKLFATKPFSDITFTYTGLYLTQTFSIFSTKLPTFATSTTNNDSK